MKRNILLTILLLLTLSFGACSLVVKDILEIKSDEYIDEEVTIKGEVTSSVKLGAVSGFTLEDETGSIAVASDAIPAEGEIITVKGILKQNLLLGYYIERIE